MTMKASAAATANCRQWGWRATSNCDIYVCPWVCSFLSVIGLVLHARLTIRMTSLADNVECSLNAVDILGFPFQECGQSYGSCMLVYTYIKFYMNVL